MYARHRLSSACIAIGVYICVAVLRCDQMIDFIVDRRSLGKRPLIDHLCLSSLHSGFKKRKKLCRCVAQSHSPSIDIERSAITYVRWESVSMHIKPEALGVFFLFIDRYLTTNASRIFSSSFSL